MHGLQIARFWLCFNSLPHKTKEKPRPWLGLVLGVASPSDIQYLATTLHCSRSGLFGRP